MDIAVVFRNIVLWRAPPRIWQKEKQQEQNVWGQESQLKTEMLMRPEHGENETSETEQSLTFIIRHSSRHELILISKPSYTFT